MTSKISRLTLLTAENIAYLDDAYDVKAVGGMILIKKLSCNQMTSHDVDSSFLLSTKVKGIRFKPEFNRLWYEHFSDKSIFLVLDAYNSLLMSGIKPTTEEVEKQLSLLK